MSSNNSENVQQSGPSTITGATSDTRTFNHRGTEVGSGNVTLSQNAAGRLDEILSWTIPKKYKMMVMAGGKHFTKAELRTVESFTGTAGDDTVQSLSANLVAISGESDLDEQPFPVAVAYNVTTGTEYDIVEVDYEGDEVTLGTDPADGDTVKIWPVISEGVVQYRGKNAFGHQVGPLDEWGVPAHVFADFDQENNRTQIFLPGAARFERDEELVLFYEGPQQIVWEDADYPRGQYVSKLEQRVDVQV